MTRHLYAAVSLGLISVAIPLRATPDGKIEDVGYFSRGQSSLGGGFHAGGFHGGGGPGGGGHR